MFATPSVNFYIEPIQTLTGPRLRLPHLEFPPTVGTNAYVTLGVLRFATSVLLSVFKAAKLPIIIVLAIVFTQQVVGVII